MIERSCAYCGAAVGDEDWERIGGTRVWCCGESACTRELREDTRGAMEEEIERVREDYDYRW
jgi:hypothetical protein